MSERNIPKKPIKSKEPRFGMGDVYFDWVCPTCGSFLAHEPNIAGIKTRCQNCTQLLLIKDGDGKGHGKKPKQSKTITRESE